MTKIAILYICTGKYSVFWKDFYESSEALFIKQAHKEYFVFTDAAEIDDESNPRVHKYQQDRLGWPYDTLMRFHIFSKAIDELKGFDYIFFFNANAMFIKEITADEFLPQTEPLAGVLHPGYYNVPLNKFPYEKKQKSSKAYINKKNGKHYFQGCLNGGKAEAFIELIQKLKADTQADLDHNIIPIWHDESFLNKYFLDKNVKILTPSYAYPEGWDLPFEPKIQMRDKALLGGSNFFRDTKDEKRPLLKRIASAVKKRFNR